MKFTDRAIKALKPENKNYELSKDNGSGLGIRVTSKGKKVFIYRYRFGKRQRGMMLGSYPEISLQEANLMHAEAHSKLKQGIDPAEEKISSKKTEINAETVSQLAELYIAHAKKNKKSWAVDESNLTKKVLPVIGHRKIKDVTRREIRFLLQKIADKTPVMANRIHSLIRRMFNFAIEEEFIEHNPCHLIKPPGGKEKSVDRVLSHTEIRNLWRGLSSLKISPITKLFIKFQLVTAQRSGEVAQMQWKDIQGNWWIIPETKNGLSHRVPLSPLAVRLLEHTKRYTSESRIFPISDTTANRAIARNRKALGVEHFTPHDLRRTAASMMASEDVSRLVIAKILNHKDSGITAVYDRHSYDKEKREALEQWSSRLLKIIRTENVNE